MLCNAHFSFVPQLEMQYNGPRRGLDLTPELLDCKPSTVTTELFPDTGQGTCIPLTLSYPLTPVRVPAYPLTLSYPLTLLRVPAYP